MKNLTLISALLILLLSCEKNGNVSKFQDMDVTVPFVLDNSVIISDGDCAGDAKTSTYLCFETVLSDSRCPTGAECIWAGDAEARFRFAVSGQNSVTFTLHTLNSFKTDTTALGYKFTLKSLTPYPSTTHFPDKSEYKAEVVVEKAGK
jgi:hypothetical protein